MITLGQAIYFLRGDRRHLSQTMVEAERDVNRGLDSMEKRAQRTGGVFGFLADSLKVTVGGAILQGLNAVGGAVKGIGQEALDSYQNNENLATSLEALVAKEIKRAGAAKDMASALAMAEKPAADLLRWTERLAILSPFESQDVSNIFQAGMNYGFVSQSADKATVSATRLTQATLDWAAGSKKSGEEMERVVRALGQMRQNGKLSLEEINQLTEAGVAAKEILADKFANGSTAALQEMISKGLLPADDAIRGIVETLEEDFAGSASRASGTLSGLRASLADLKTVGLREFFGGTIRAVQPYLQKLVDTLTKPEVMQRIRAMGDALGEKVGRALAWLANTGVPAFVRAWGFVSNAVDVARGALDGIWQFLNGFGQAIKGYGEGWIAQLAQGMLDGAAYVVDALSSVGDLITDWLMPHSPPKLLPDLDKWGAGAMTVYMNGWKDGDFSVFDTISRFIQDRLSTLVESGQLAETGLVPAVLGSRAAVADAINQLRQTGDIAEDTFARIREAAGPAGDQVVEFVRLIEQQADAERALDEAQRELNDTTERYDGILAGLQDQLDETKAKYEEMLGGLREELKRTERAFDDQLDPLDAQLEAIDRQQQAIRDNQRLAELQEVLNDKEASAEEKQLARLEMEEIQIRRQQQAIEDQKKAAVDAAQDKIDAAEQERDAALKGQEDQIAAIEKERETAINAAQQRAEAAQDALDASNQELKSRQAIADAESENVRLLKQQADLLEQMAKAAKKGGGAGGKPTAGARKPVVPDYLKNLPQTPGQAADAAGNAAKQRYLDFKQGLVDSANEITRTSPAFQAGIALFERIEAGFQRVATVFAPVVEGVRSFGGEVRTAFAEGGAAGGVRFLLDKLAEVSPLFRMMRAAVEEALPPIQSIVQSVFGIVGGFMQTNGADIVRFVQETWGKVQQIANDLIPPIKQIVGTVFGGVADFLKTHSEEIQGFLTTAWTYSRDIIRGVIEIIQLTVVPALQYIGNFIQEHSDAIKLIIEGAWTAMKGIIEGALQMIKGAIDIVLGLIKGDWEQVWNGVKDIAEGAWNGISGIVDGALKTIKGTIDMASDLIGDALDGIWGRAKTGAERVWKSIVNIVIDAVNGVINTLNQAIDGANELNPFGDIGRINPIPRYARGTPAGGHPGGGALFGEDGAERLRLPGGAQYLAMGPTLANLPRGTQVESNADLAKSIAEAVAQALGGGLGGFSFANYGPIGSQMDVANLLSQIEQLIRRRYGK